MERSLAAEAEARRLLDAGKLSEALSLIRTATGNAGQCTTAHGLEATILLRRGERDAARAVIQAAMALPCKSADALDALAYASLKAGDHDSANRLYRRALEHAPGEARLWYNLAASERSFGRMSDAEAYCNRAIELDPSFLLSYLLRSELRQQTQADNHIVEMERYLDRHPSDERARVVIGYCLGKELDDLREYDRAFTWFAKAASARRRFLAYDVAVDERKMQRVQSVYVTGPAPDETTATTGRGDVFICGLPRSGTTLLERVLTQLPRVRTNGETDHFSNALLAGAAATGSDVFARCAASNPGVVSKRYRELAGQTAGGWIIEKMPLNFLYLGAIRRNLPAATPLLVERSPLDSCFAMYRTLFGMAYPFSYDFSDLARYYAAYATLMRHWRETLGDWLVRVNYTQLVREPAITGRSLAGACGMTWTDAAVAIENNASVATTASATQVRRPIYQTSVERWRHYDRHLQPLIDALRTAGIADPEKSP